MPLPWDDEDETPQLPATQADNPKRLLQVSFAQPNVGGSFPALPANINSVHMKQHVEQLANLYLTTPGLVDTELTEDDKKHLTAVEIMLYEDIRSALSPAAPQAKRQFWLERIMPPQLRRVESVQVTGDVKDWRSTLKDTTSEIVTALAEAERLEENRWTEDAEVAETSDAEP